LPIDPGQEDFPSVTLPWINQGYEIQFFKNRITGEINLDDIEAVRTEQGKILVISHAQYANGLRVDLDLLGEYCERHKLRSSHLKRK
jgi:selenocysteine lyase/cysteine desulfurase